MRERRIVLAAAASGFGGAAIAVLLLGGASRGPAASAGPDPRETARAFREVARKVRPGVVHLTRERVVQEEPDPFLEMMERFFRDRGAPRRPLKERAYGTGFIVRSDGTCLTNNHVAGGGGKLVAKLWDGREVEARVVGADQGTDLAVIDLEGEGFQPVELGNSDTVEVGDWALAFGCPFGLEQTMTVGVVSAKGRSRVGVAPYEDFIQTDAAINPGNSGGPLVDIDGRVIGINTAIASRSGGYQGVGFSIPVNMARPIMESLMASGHVVRGWLGVGIDPEVTGGARVKSVVPEGPAERAGLKGGDLIVALDGKPVDSPERLKLLAAAAAPGRVIPVEVVRDGKRLTLELKVDERTLEGERPPSVGITAKKLSPELAAKFALPEDARGIVVVEIAPGSLAERAGIKCGHVIRSIDGRPIRTMEDLDAAVGRADARAGIAIVVWDGKRELAATLRARS